MKHALHQVGWAVKQERRLKKWVKEDSRMISGRYRVLPRRKSLLFWTSPSREHNASISTLWFEEGAYEGDLNENSTLLEGLVIAPQKKKNH